MVMHMYWEITLKCEFAQQISFGALGPNKEIYESFSKGCPESKGVGMQLMVNVVKSSGGLYFDQCRLWQQIFAKTSGDLFLSSIAHLSCPSPFLAILLRELFLLFSTVTCGQIPNAQKLYIQLWCNLVEIEIILFSLQSKCLQLFCPLLNPSS